MKQENVICGCGSCSSEYQHNSDCAVHNMPAIPNGECDCRLENFGTAVMFLEWVQDEKYWRTAKRLGGGWFKIGVGGCYTTNELFKIFLKYQKLKTGSNNA